MNDIFNEPLKILGLAIFGTAFLVIPILLFNWFIRWASDRTPVKLPATFEEIIQRLCRVSDEESLIEKLYPKIAEHAGQEVLPRYIVFIIAMAAHDYSQEYPPPISNIIRLYIPRWIDALIDNKGSAAAAKAWMKRVENQIAAKIKARTPPRVEPEGPIENDDLYAAVMKVRDIYFEEIERIDVNKLISLIERRNDGANPFYDQTESGLFVEYYYGHPNKIWTPWGYFQMCGSVGYRGDAPWEEILKNFTERTGATLFAPERTESYGVVGPVYALHKIDDMILPEPRLRERQNYLEYEVVVEAWKNMTRRFQAITVKK